MDLQKYLELRKRLSIKEALLIGQSVADALFITHSLSLVHRDLSMDNILVSIGEDNEVIGCQITDFGIARRSDAASHTQIQGKINWLAPELLSARGEVSPTKGPDIYYFGLVRSMFQFMSRKLLTGLLN
jgi:serine/threonine-protein kinase